MQVKELIGTLENTDRLFKRHNLPNQYRKLISALNQARKKPTPETTAKIIQLKERIREAHNAAEPENKTPYGRKIYEKIGASNLLGKNAMDRIDNIFQTHEADPPSVANALEELVDQTSGLMDRVRTLMDGLTSLAEEEIHVSQNGTTMQLFFEKGASVFTIQDLEDSLEKWNRVLAAFSRLSRQPLEDSKIANIQQGPLTIELSIFDDVASAIGKATCEVLNVYENYLNIKKVGLEVNNLKLKNKGISQQLDKEADLLIKSTATEVTKALMIKFDWKAETGKNEVQNSVKTAVATIFDFVKDGGKIEVREGGKTESKVQKELTKAFSQVHNLEDQIEQFSPEQNPIPLDAEVIIPQIEEEQ